MTVCKVKSVHREITAFKDIKEIWAHKDTMAFRVTKAKLDHKVLLEHKDTKDGKEL